MSGTHRAYIRPDPRGQLRSLCRAEARNLQGLGLLPDVEDIEQQIAGWRKQAKELRAQVENGTGNNSLLRLLDQMDRRREDISLLIHESRNAFKQARETLVCFRNQIQTAEHLAERSDLTLAQVTATNAQLSTARTAAQAAFHSIRSLVERVELANTETATLAEHVHSELTPKGRAQPITGDSRRDKHDKLVNAMREGIIKEAKRRQLSETLRGISAEPSEGWKEIEGWQVSAQLVQEFRQELQNAENQLAAGDLNEAERSAAKAEAKRSELLDQSARNHEIDKRNAHIANAIMQALCDRNYNTPKYGPLEASKHPTGIQIRADVPNTDGKGNIRVNLHFDGKTEIEVENVPDGEEQLCGKLIGEIGQELAKQGMQLEVTDWGRLRKSPPEPLGVLPSKTIERAREIGKDRDKL